MAFTYNLSDEIGRVRLLIPDNKETGYIFEDEEIDTFLVLESGVKRSAALALETIASNEAMVLKVIKLLDVQTDGAKLAEALLKRAATLRKQAQDEDDVTGVEDSFAVVEWILTPNQYAEAALRNSWYPDNYPSGWSQLP